MKKFTSLLIILLFASVVNAQETQRLRHKNEKMQEVLTRFSMHTKSSSPNHSLLISGSRAVAVLKNAVARQKLDSVLYHEYVQESGVWQNLWKDEYQYDSGLKNTTWIEKEWDSGSETWTAVEKVNIDYTQDGKVNAMDIYTPDEITGELIYLNRTVAYYSPEGLADSVIHYRYVVEPLMNWEVEGKEIYHYNEAGQPERIEITSQEEDEEGVYYLVMALVFTYNHAGQISALSMYIIDSELQLLFSESTYIYDDSGRLTANEVSAMDFFTAEFGPVSRTGYEYNATGDVTVETFSSWDSATEEWYVEQKSEYTYNQMLFSEVVFPSYLQFMGVYDQTETFSHVVSEIVTSSNNEGEWSLSDRTLFYYSEGTATGVADYTKAAVSVYPNPASDNITFRWNGDETLRLEVYHITGAKAMELRVASGMKIPVSTLDEGVYVLKLLKDNQTIYAGKLVKR